MQKIKSVIFIFIVSKIYKYKILFYKCTKKITCKILIRIQFYAIYFLYCLLTYKEKLKKTLKSQQISKKNENLKIIQYINDHYKTISLEKISQHFHYSIPYCSKWIKEKTGYSYYELLTHIKLQKVNNYYLIQLYQFLKFLNNSVTKIPNLLFVPLKIQTITPQAYRKNEQ